MENVETTVKETLNIPALSFVSQALQAYEQSFQSDASESSLSQRARKLARAVLGKHLSQATTPDDNPTIFQIDTLELVFHCGANPSDDYFKVTFLGIANRTPFRTFAGLGKAIDEIMTTLQAYGEVITDALASELEAEPEI